MTFTARQRAALLSLICSFALSSCVLPPPETGLDPSAEEEVERPTAVGADWRIPQGAEEITEGEPAGGEAADPQDGNEDGTACAPIDCSAFCGQLQDECGQTADCGTCAEPASLQVSALSATLIPTETWKVAVQVLDTQGKVVASPQIAWASDDVTIVTIARSADGGAMLRGVRDGSTKVKGRLGALTAELEIAVEDGFSAIAAGVDHTCALTESGRAYCWGEGPLGAGDGKATGLRRVNTGERFAEIAAGRDHTCAIREDRTAVFCWGSNAEQQIAGLTAASSTAPVQVQIPTAAPYDGLVAGGGQTCLKAGEQPFCWGGASAEAPTPGYTGLDSIALGEQFGCGLENDTDVTCWGPATESIPSGEAMSSMRILEGGDDDDLLQLRTVVAGADHACVLGADDGVYCWGSNEFGQVDSDVGAQVDRPDRVDSVEYLILGAGPEQTCAGRTADKKQVDCWGRAARDATFAHDVTQIAVGGSHACALLNDKSVSCWGANDAGQLGNGTTVEPLGPVAVVGEITD